MEYDKVRTILMHVDSAKQLRAIEEASPQIMGEDAECWVRLIQKDCMSWRKVQYFPDPARPTAWHEVYDRYQREEAEELESAAARLKAHMDDLRRQRESKVTHIASNSAQRLLPKQPRMRAGPNEKVTKSYGSSSSSKPKSKLAQLRNGVKLESAMRRAAINPVVPRTVLREAPQAMVDDYRRASQPVVALGPRIRVPRTTVVNRSRRLDPVERLENEEREMRTYGVVLPPSTEERARNDRNATVSSSITKDKSPGPLATTPQQRQARQQPAHQNREPSAATATGPSQSPSLLRRQEQKTSVKSDTSPLRRPPARRQGLLSNSPRWREELALGSAKTTSGTSGSSKRPEGIKKSGSSL